jgi:ISXO2-like transposase domain
VDVHGKFAIAECGDPEVADDFLPMIHLVFANLKTWLLGTHHGVSAKHLQAYPPGESAVTITQLEA